MLIQVKTLLLILAITFLYFIGSTSQLIGASFHPEQGIVEFPNYDPFLNEGIYVLKDTVADELVTHCKIKPDEYLDYWLLSEPLIRLIEKRLKPFLTEHNYIIGKKKPHKQYFGMKTASNHKFIYLFVYPPPSSAIDKVIGNHILLCGKISKSYLILEFDYKSLKFKVL